MWQFLWKIIWFFKFFNKQSFQRKGNYFMKNENLKHMLVILTQTLEKNGFGKDKQKIQYLSSELEKIENQIPTYSKLEELQKIVTDLEVKYDDYNELSNYFDPLYVEIKSNIHNNDVKKLREENRRKREKN